MLANGAKSLGAMPGIELVPIEPRSHYLLRRHVDPFSLESDIHVTHITSLSWLWFHDKIQE